MSPKNYEVLARAQASTTYYIGSRDLPTTRDASDEIKNPKGDYILRVSRQYETVMKYSGIAGFAFENVATMISQSVKATDGISLNSVLGNLVTGTPVGSTEAKFIPPIYGKSNRAFRKSAARKAEDNLNVATLNAANMMQLGLPMGAQPASGIGGLQQALLDSLSTGELDFAGMNVPMLTAESYQEAVANMSLDAALPSTSVVPSIPDVLEPEVVEEPEDMSALLIEEAQVIEDDIIEVPIIQEVPYSSEDVSSIHLE